MATAPVDIFGPPANDEAGLFPASPPKLPASPSMFTEPEPPKRAPIDKLRPGSEPHTRVMEKLMAMLRFSNNKLSPHFSRFKHQEMKVQAYLLNRDSKEIVDLVESSKGNFVPEPVNVVVPYTYATLHAATTYMATVLLGRKPVFPLMGVRNTSVDSARYMEQVLTHNLDASRATESLFQHIWDSLLYSYSPVYIGWAESRGKVMRIGADGERLFTNELKFAGNKLATVDPYKFRPDPRVPMHKCNTDGDFMFYLDEISHSVLHDREAAGEYKWVKQALALNRNISRRRNYESSNRGEFGRSVFEASPRDVVGFAEVCVGTVRLVPKDWGLGDETESELWHFTFLPEGQIISAAPYEAMHERHPFVVGEPTTLGHDFMSLSMSEMISVFQDLLSWLVSSRMENVRASIANSYVFDPARVEVNDIQSSAIGRMIRLKQSAMGLPVGEAIKQLQVNDVTGGHFTDINIIRTLADSATGVNDNLRGIQQGSGRRSATEARITMQAGASRLSQLAMRLSGQSFNGLAEQMISNIQQWMPKDLWMEFSGDDGTNTSSPVDLNSLVGSFNYQISDGSLPLDKGALIDQWKEILMGIAQDPELRQNWDINEIFRYVAELAGAKNIDSFKKQQRPTIAPPGMDPSGGEAAGVPAPQLPAALSAGL